MIGCTAQLETKKPKPVIIEPPNNVIVEKIPKWDPEKKQYWTSMLFSKMAQQPQARQAFTPWHLYKIAVCAIDLYEKTYSLAFFEKNLGNHSSQLAPKLSAVAYNITYGCTVQQKLIQQKELVKPQHTI